MLQSLAIPGRTCYKCPAFCTKYLLEPILQGTGSQCRNPLPVQLLFMMSNTNTFIVTSNTGKNTGEGIFKLEWYKFLAAGKSCMELSLITSWGDFNFCILGRGSARLSKVLVQGMSTTKKIQVQTTIQLVPVTWVSNHCALVKHKNECCCDLSLNSHCQALLT